MFFTSSIIVSAPKSSAQPGERQRQQWWQLSQRSHACFRLSAATAKRDLKGGALRFESTAADDAEGRFLGSPAIASPPRAGCCPAQAWLPSYGGCCPPVTWLCAGALCAMPAQATVKVAGSAWLRVQPASAVTTIPSSSPGAPARARASCSRAHTCVRVHAHPPPVVATCSPNRDQVIVSDLLCLYAFAHVVEWPKLNNKVQICEMDLIGRVAGATVNLGCM